ncbi:MAG: WD40 repeat domain-containing protein [Planctomycetes bacterium]|nr:WD40 repeat domain-containing protein [Planctomycetota bacterium]
MTATNIELNSLAQFTHNNAVYWAAFSSDGKQLASASLDNTVKLWNVESREHVGTLKGHGDGVAYVGYLADGRIVTASLDRNLKVWSADGVLKSTIAGHQDYLTCAAAAPRGTLVASGGFDKVVRLWDADLASSRGVLSGHEGSVLAVAVSPDTSLVASGGNDRTVRIWDVEERKQVHVLSGHNASIEAVDFSPRAKLLASADMEGRIRIWTLSGETADSFESGAARIRSLGFSPDGEWLAGGDGTGTVRIWNVADRTELARVAAHRNTVYSVRFSSGGKLLATAGFDRTVRLFGVSRG